MLKGNRGGRNFASAECQAWIREAGFRETGVGPLVALHAIAVGIE
jgi:hypothetical protein